MDALCFLYIVENCNMTQYFIGVDIGTGSVKGLAVDKTGKVLSSSQHIYPTLHPEEGRSEQDPELIWAAFVQCIKDIASEQKNQPGGIALSTAMHSLIVMGKNNKQLSPMITWADNRAGKIADRIRSSAAGEMIYEQNGTPIHAMTPLCKIVWIKENDPVLFEHAAKFISIKEFIWLKLFHTYEVDHSIASATGLMNIETLQWNDNALSLAGITLEKLSNLVDTDFTRNQLDPAVANQMGIPTNTPVVIGASDGCMANLGSFAIEPGIGALTIGTSGAVRIASRKPVFNFSAMTFNYRLDRETFICGGPSNNGGVVLRWYAESLLKTKLSTAADYKALLDSVTTTLPGAEGLIFLPYIQGERAPIWNSDACGVFFGIRSHHTQAHFTRAVLEGISMALYNIAENMEQCGLMINQLNVSGGFIHSSSWLQILANIFGKKISLINTSDASALGAAYLGMKKNRMINSFKEVEPAEAKVIFSEKEFSELYSLQYKTYCRLYENLSENMKL
jgi:gluconokinase